MSIPVLSVKSRGRHFSARRDLQSKKVRWVGRV
jgi:hypothetical protein